MMWGTSSSFEVPDSRGEATPGGYPPDSRTRTPNMLSGRDAATLMLKFDGDALKGAKELADLWTPPPKAWSRS